MSRTYIFIDGAAFCESIGGFLDYFGANFRDLNWQTISKNADRIFYFDALPVRKADEDASEFARKLAAKEGLFSYLRRVPNMHVREGFTRIRQSGRNPPLTQKGVDIALTVEVLTHASSGNIDEARIFANDLDFYPLLDALTNTKVKSLLYFNRRKTAAELLEVADVAEEINLFSVYNWLPTKYRNRFSLEGRNPDEESDGLELVREGIGAYGTCSLYKIESNAKFLLLGPMGDRGDYVCVSNSSELLTSHFESTAAFPIDWKAPTIQAHSEQ